MQNKKFKPIKILLVEDNPADIVLTRHALKSARLNNDIDIASDGEQAMEMLNGVGEFKNMAQPDLVILDLNLPKIEGRDVLKRIKNTDSLKHIPIVIMSGSGAEKDKRDAKELNAACYIQKPLDLEKIIEIIKNIDKFSLSILSYSEN